MPVGLRLRDAYGELGNAVPDRLGRILFYGTLAAGQSISVPDLDYVISPVGGDGCIFVNSNFAGLRALVDPGTQGVNWNNTTKVMTNITGASRPVWVVSFRRQIAPSGTGVGLRYIKNSNNEVIVDNTHETLEIIDEGTSVITQGTPQSLTTYPRAGYANQFLFIRWDYVNVAILRGNNAMIMTTGSTLATTSVDWKIAVMNPQTTRGGTGVGMALYRPSDGVCTFSTWRKYARLRSIFAFETDPPIVNGPTIPDYFNTKSGVTIPTNCFFNIQPSYRTGSSGYFFNRDPGLPLERFTGFLGGPVSAGQATTLGIPTLGSYPGAFHGCTLIINP